jgi:hypothetical protein
MKFSQKYPNCPNSTSKRKFSFCSYCLKIISGLKALLILAFTMLGKLFGSKDYLRPVPENYILGRHL